MVAPAIQYTDTELSIRFDRNAFGIEAYERFLQVKRLPEFHIDFDPDEETYVIRAPRRFATLLGELPPQGLPGDLPLSPFLLDDQAAIVPMALEAKRYAVWSDCGLGKTLIAAEFARHVIHRTGGRVLIVTLNDIVDGFIEEIQKFYGDSLPVHRIKSRAELREWCKGTGPGLAITNYEKFNPEEGSNENQVIDELRYLAGIILDESSRLKTGGGKQKWAIIKSSKGIEYKLSCTATPAPNDTMEFASQASFLERMRSEGEIIWTYFHRNKKTHRWQVKRNAREDFFRFMAGWSIYVRDPRKYGWRLQHQPVPEPIIERIDIEATDGQRIAMRRFQRDANGQTLMFERDTNAIERVKLSEIAKGFLYRESPGNVSDIESADQRKPKRFVERIPSRKPAIVAKLIAEQLAAGRQTLVWTQFDAETDLIVEALQEHGITPAVITGRVPKRERPAILQAFRKGETPLLIARAKMLGYGQNFQQCKSMIFSGWNDSYEEWYQAIRRAVRFGQVDRVRVFIPVVNELEGDMLENIFGKEAKHLAAIAEMEANYVRAVRAMTAVPTGSKL